MSSYSNWNKYVNNGDFMREAPTLATEVQTAINNGQTVHSRITKTGTYFNCYSPGGHQIAHASFHYTAGSNGKDGGNHFKSDTNNSVQAFIHTNYGGPEYGVEFTQHTRPGAGYQPLTNDPNTQALSTHLLQSMNTNRNSFTHDKYHIGGSDFINHDEFSIFALLKTTYEINNNKQNSNTIIINTDFFVNNKNKEIINILSYTNSLELDTKINHSNFNYSNIKLFDNNNNEYIHINNLFNENIKSEIKNAILIHYSVCNVCLPFIINNNIIDFNKIKLTKEEDINNVEKLNELNNIEKIDELNNIEKINELNNIEKINELNNTKKKFDDNYKNKYIKYKNKYLELKKIFKN